MTDRLVALLDKPYAASFGLVPVVVESNGELTIRGLAYEPPRRISKEDLEDMDQRGFALILPAPVDIWRLPVDENGQVAAGWVGADWERKAKASGAFIELPSRRHSAGPEGTFWIDTPKRVFEEIDRWLLRAAGRALRLHQHSEVLSELMRRTLPDRLETRAITWMTCSSEMKDRRLEWYEQMESHEGRSVSKEQLRENFKKYIDSLVKKNLPQTREVGRRRSQHAQDPAAHPYPW